MQIATKTPLDASTSSAQAFAVGEPVEPRDRLRHKGKFEKKVDNIIRISYSVLVPWLLISYH
jgi:hypothetical protein